MASGPLGKHLGAGPPQTGSKQVRNTAKGQANGLNDSRCRPSSGRKFTGYDGHRIIQWKVQTPDLGFPPRSSGPCPAPAINFPPQWPWVWTAHEACSGGPIRAFDRVCPRLNAGLGSASWLGMQD
jgi:hypothetical protein